MTGTELYDYAVSLLAKKNYASGDMHRQLTRQTEKTEDVERVLRLLTDDHYLNDAQFAAYLLDKHVKKLHGPTRIKQELWQKGKRTIGDVCHNLTTPSKIVSTYF
jgi:regulatory protein